MSEFVPTGNEILDERPIDRELVVGRMQEYGVGIELEDLEDEDDNDIMGIVATYATMHDVDLDEIFPQVLPIEERFDIEAEPDMHFEIEEMNVEDIDAATEMRKQSWIDTYVNEEAGITKEWIEEYFSDKLSDENRPKRIERFVRNKEAGVLNAWLARDEKGEIIGSTTPFIQEDGTQRVGSIYVDKKWLGKGVGSQLMQKVIEWFDPEKPIELGVVSYNERAKAFYRKWGFEEIEGSETLYADKIPEVRMIRKASNEI